MITSWSVVYAKLRLREVDAVVSTGLQLLCGCLVLFWGTWALEAHRPALWTRSALLAIAFLTVFGSGAAFVIYYWLLKTMQPYQLATISFVTPLIALLEGLVMGEPVEWMMLAAMCVVLASVGFVLRAEAEKQPEEKNILMLSDGAQ